MDAQLRDYRPGDEAAAYYICLKTGDHGDDGEPYFQEDPDALGRIFVGPYLAFEPELALMLEDDEGVCGYALGALDTRRFYDRYEREWRPKLCAQFPEPSGDRSKWTRVQLFHYMYHHPEYYFPQEYEQYPAHLHIDLLPRAHRKGHGRRMMEELMHRMRGRGAPGVHLGLNALNDRAYAFYRALGFVELERQGSGESGSIYMGKRLNQ